LPLTTAMWHYARGVSFAVKKDFAGAQTERHAFQDAAKAVPKDAEFGKNKAHDLLGIAEKMLDGELLYREGQTDRGIAALREAVHREDSLHYIEPPAWIQPVRHALGATLMAADRFAEAEAVYREDLARYPENGWSLFGLSRSLHRQGKTAEATAVTARFERTWQHADVKLSSSCYCLEGKDE
jgi:tetratricopeptide (TPR) repeat protein